MRKILLALSFTLSTALIFVNCKSEKDKRKENLDILYSKLTLLKAERDSAHRAANIFESDSILDVEFKKEISSEVFAKKLIMDHIADSFNKKVEAVQFSIDSLSKY